MYIMKWMKEFSRAWKVPKPPVKKRQQKNMGKKFQNVKQKVFFLNQVRNVFWASGVLIQYYYHLFLVMKPRMPHT